MGFNRYKDVLQTEILDEIEGLYKTDRSSTLASVISSRKYFLGCDHVYYIYAFYGLLHTLKDEVTDDEKPSYCHLTKKEMNDLYARLRSDKNNSSIKKILERNKNNVCSYCFNSRAEEIDHFLVKSHFPSFSFIYNNLIPSCKSCNHRKGTLKPDINKSNWFIYPVLEKISEDFYLDCKFENEFTKFSFYIEANRVKNFTSKIEFTFSKLKIFQEYDRLAHNEIITIFTEIKIREIISLKEIMDFLLIKIMTNKKSFNYIWKRSLYKFLLNEVNFLRLGYKKYLSFYNF